MQYGWPFLIPTVAWYCSMRLPAFLPFSRTPMSRAARSAVFLANSDASINHTQHSPWGSAELDQVSPVFTHEAVANHVAKQVNQWVVEAVLVKNDNRLWGHVAKLSQRQHLKQFVHAAV